MKGNRFEKETHRYFTGDRELISVTTLMVREGLVEDFFFTEESRDRGLWVHERCTDYDLNASEKYFTVDLSKDARAEGWWPYFEAWMKFRAMMPGLKFLAIEVPIFRPDLGLAGRPDRVGLFRRQAVIVDLKTGAPSPMHGVQMALYDLLLGQLPLGVRRRFACYLQEDGDYRMREFKDRSDLDEAVRLAHIAKEER